MGIVAGEALDVSLEVVASSTTREVAGSVIVANTRLGVKTHSSVGGDATRLVPGSLSRVSLLGISVREMLEHQCRHVTCKSRGGRCIELGLSSQLVVAGDADGGRR